MEGDEFIMRLRGQGKSPRYGQGGVTVLADTQAQAMYVTFDFEALRETQCLKYPFPKVSDFQAKAKKLDRREERVRRGLKDAGLERRREQHRKVPDAVTLQWTRHTDLKLVFGPKRGGGEALTSLEMKRGEHVLKLVRIFNEMTVSERVPEDAEFLFRPPRHCKEVTDVQDPIAEVQLKPPHSASSALSDLLLAMATRKLSEHKLFLLLSAFAVPGDISVMIEDPQPPNLALRKFVGFDYRTTNFEGNVHKSYGSVWLDVQRRAFHLRGEAVGSKVGHVDLDLLAVTKPLDVIYSNVALKEEEERQCVMYDFPQLPESVLADQETVAYEGLHFAGLGEYEDEDCAIFKAPLPRGRWIRLWVDLDTKHADAILRTEVHSHTAVLRQTDILTWHAVENILPELKPDMDWHCSRSISSESKIGHLGLDRAHLRSFELQDALEAVRQMPTNFMVLEVLALTGDVNLLVQEPDLPDFRRVGTYSFRYRAADGERLPVTGQFEGMYGGVRPAQLSATSQATRFCTFSSRAASKTTCAPGGCAAHCDHERLPGAEGACAGAVPQGGHGRTCLYGAGPEDRTGSLAHARRSDLRWHRADWRS
eukprot:TRINITY_DN14013_c0_g1_i5.p1 TRINITY_DN14013_c0_g1~~TRINITY_DN14013_c0_g1_i5.p1  ORF type:complete len:693 (+),score=124.80 TRINITY_DN14013_c0_g1_i5:300-2081(+)